MLELKNVSKTFNPGTINAKTALSGLDLRLNDGDFVTVIGGNGAGKSTMLNAIAGAFEVDGGSISIDGTDITRPSEHKRAAPRGRNTRSTAPRAPCPCGCGSSGTSRPRPCARRARPSPPLRRR